MNRNGIITMLFLLPVVTFAVTDSTSQKSTTDSMTAAKPAATADQPAAAKDTLRQFTIEELSKYNGNNGNPVYVAINDTVYDFTSVTPWKGGNHHGNKAGMDLSEKIKKSPHGTKVLKNKKIVGILIKKTK